MKKGKRAFLALLAALLTALPACAESGEPSIPSAPSSSVLEGESLVPPAESIPVPEVTPAPEEESLPPVSSALESASPASEREESREDGGFPWRIFRTSRATSSSRDFITASTPARCPCLWVCLNRSLWTARRFQP